MEQQMQYPDYFLKQTDNDPTTTDEAMITAVTRAQTKTDSTDKQPEKITEEQAEQQAADLTAMNPADNTENADFISLDLWCPLI